MELLAGHPVFPCLLLEDTSASTASAALTPSGPRASPLLWGISSTGHPTIPAQKQRNRPPQKVLCWHSLALCRDLLSCCHLFKVAAHHSRFSPASMKQPLFVTASHHTSPAEPPLSGCYCPSTGITCTAKSHLFFPYIFALPVGYQHQECQAPPSSQESKRAALAAKAVPLLPVTSSLHLQGPGAGLYAHCWAWAEQRLPIVLHCT